MRLELDSPRPLPVIDLWFSLKNRTEYRKECVLPNRCSHSRGNDYRAETWNALRSQRARWIIFTMVLFNNGIMKKIGSKLASAPNCEAHSLSLFFLYQLFKSTFPCSSHTLLPWLGVRWGGIGDLSYDPILSISGAHKWHRMSFPEVLSLIQMVKEGLFG